MPTNVVKTKRDERLWAMAKHKAKKGVEKKWAYLMTVFQNMKHRTGNLKKRAVGYLKKKRRK